MCPILPLLLGRRVVFMSCTSLPRTCTVCTDTPSFARNPMTLESPGFPARNRETSEFVKSGTKINTSRAAPKTYLCYLMPLCHEKRNRSPQISQFTSIAMSRAAHMAKLAR